MKFFLVLCLGLSFVACGDAGFQREPASEESPPASDDQVAEEPAPPPFYDPGREGPYEVSSFSDGLADPSYSSAIVYYPKDSEAVIVGATTLSGGFTNTKEHMSWLAEHLASHGIITLVFTPTNNQTLNAAVWATGHKGAFQKLKAEGGRAGSPIQGRVDGTKIGIMGYSMGGAGTLLAVNELGPAVKAAVPICAFRPVTPTASVPLLFLTGTNDTVAIPGNIIRAYEAMPSGVPKALANFNGMTHLDVTNGGSALQHENIAYFATAYYQIHLGRDERYRSALKEKAGAFASPADFRMVPET